MHYLPLLFTEVPFYYSVFMMCISVLEYIPFGDMFTLWTFHGYFPESLVRIYVAELAMVLGELNFEHSLGDLGGLPRRVWLG